MNGVAYPVSQFDPSSILIVVSVILLIIVIIIVFLLVSKNEEFKELKNAYDKIMQTFDELDQQAKLIVKTDLELNKAQEELDRRLLGLNTLQKLARKMNTSRDENEVFQWINEPLITALGFSRAMVLAYGDDKKLICRATIGLEPKKTTVVPDALSKNEQLIEPLREGITFSSLSSSQKIRSSIVQIFDTEHFILTPLLSQQQLAGLLFVGNRYNAPAVNEGDEELISVLASQLAQTFENVQLFEQVYRSSQMLEIKVNDRTKELTHALKEVAEISKKKTEFISAVSHELRTPLTSIKGYAAILMTGKVGEIPLAVKERLGKINTHSDNLVKLINDLLDIARIESGRVEMKAIAQPIRTMVDNIADLLIPQLSAKSLVLKTNIPTDVPPIEFDSSQVERVFINLISNAIKFTPTNGTISINVLPNFEKQEALVEVADTGIGMKKDDLAKVFDEFFRVDNEINMNVKGTGLGLALVKNIVEAHNGHVWVTSDVGVGTTFHFNLPFKHVPREQKKQKSPTGDA
ncbi:MAG: GAF domain-containing sensor histidine kinase [Candidatus Omnitrophica bacterium]|nr:GAF domain-containing sensor histidine kinase [Candidatus Omnitrophota bacterium]